MVFPLTHRRGFPHKLAGVIECRVHYRADLPQPERPARALVQNPAERIHLAAMDGECNFSVGTNKMNPETSSKGLFAGKLARISELVSYQDGSIVSREIIKKSTGSVTIFAFDEGQGLSEHTAPFDALVQVVEGETEIVISGHPHRLQGGEMILMPAGQPHALKALTRFKMILTMIRS